MLLKQSLTFYYQVFGCFRRLRGSRTVLTDSCIRRVMEILFLGVCGTVDIFHIPLKNLHSSATTTLLSIILLLYINGGPGPWMPSIFAPLSNSIITLLEYNNIKTCKK